MGTECDGDDPLLREGPAEKMVGTDFPASTGYLLARAGAEARRRFARMLAEHGMNPHHFGVLMALEDLGRSGQQGVSEAIGVDPRNTTTLIDALLQRGLLRRSRDTGDRRRHVLELTTAGRSTVLQLRRAAEGLEEEMLRGLNPVDRRTLHQLLSTILATPTEQAMDQAGSRTSPCPGSACPG